MTFKELCTFARKHGLTIIIKPDPMGDLYPPSIHIRALKENCQYSSVLTFDELDNDGLVNYVLEHLRCSIDARLPKTATYLEEFVKHNNYLFETARLIHERCPGHYFTDGPVQSPTCQDPEHPDCIGCTTCWNMRCNGIYMRDRIKRFPDDAEEVYK